MKEIRIIKEYKNLKYIDAEKITFDDGMEYSINGFKSIERNADVEEPYFVFVSDDVDLRIIFRNKGLSAKKRNQKEFLDFQIHLRKLGIKSKDLS